MQVIYPYLSMTCDDNGCRADFAPGSIDWAIPADKRADSSGQWTANGLVVRFQHLHSIDTSRRANVGIKRTASRLLILVDFLNLTFGCAPDVKRDANVKFNPLDQVTK